jgi:hypothetical protein
MLANTKITKDLIIRSATAFPEVQTELEQLGVADPSEMAIRDFVAAIRASHYPDRYLYQANAREEPDTEYPAFTSRYAQPGLDVWDARTLTNMVITGVVNTDVSSTETIDGNEVEWFTIDDQYAVPVTEIYRSFSYFNVESPPGDVGRVFTSLRNDVGEYDALQRSMLDNIGEITFGFPIVYTAAEKGLVLPESLKRLYDVYWIDLVVTYRGIDPDDLAEMAFNVELSDQSVALKLIPLRFGLEMSVNEKIAAPELGVEYSGVKLTVGEYFSQTVAFKYLKPIVEGYGEGEARFSWRMAGEAINAGSHRFAAIIAVPEGTPDVDFRFSGHVRLRKSFVGAWYDGELIAGTDAWVLPVSF